MSFLSRRGSASRRRKNTDISPSSSTPLLLPDIELSTDRPALLTVSPADPAAHWAAGHRGALRAAVTEHGSVLVRGLGLRDAAEVGAVFEALADSLMSDREAFASRRTYADGVYSSTAWPPNQPMCMHHEASYRREFPGLLLFACLEAPERGGATGVADAESVLAALPPELTKRFERDGWLLTRSYNNEIGASVAEAFGTDGRTAVEAYCRAHAIRFAWQPDGSLLTRQRRAAVLRHPVTGRRCWFNQIAFLSEWTMDPEVREYLVDMYGPDGLPFNTRYGDGDPIGADVIETLNEVYEAHTVREPWRPGDLLLVDNIRSAHSREPFEGPREVLVGMADPVRPADLDTRDSGTGDSGTGDSGTGDSGTGDSGTQDSDSKDEVSFT
ncbi:TauD/TfdA family dioxygenase [Streptomyces adelaidensis]|uniref:TauD/TfdA family dioxygenase n=1 Tax=Streptomyces adelaidensis TaxID=2796465 RepID=UPI001906AD51|nr:TauD/TfdA family dioxygenase [Streptomyces adelaidensis]